jgi:hypothetical protein
MEGMGRRKRGNGGGGSAHDRAISRTASQKAIQPMVDLQPPQKTPANTESSPEPLYRTPEFAAVVALLSLALAALFVVLGVRMKNLSWFFVIAWIFASPAWYILCKWLLKRWRLFVFAVLLLTSGVALFFMDRYTRTPEAAPVTIVWQIPSSIPFGVGLSSTQLNAKAISDKHSVDGDWIYNPTFGATLQPGTQTLHVSFRSTHPDQYKDAEATIAIVVDPPIAKATEPAAEAPKPPSSGSKVPFPDVAPDLPQLGFQDDSDSVSATFGPSLTGSNHIYMLKQMNQPVFPVTVDGFAPLAFRWDKVRSRVSYTIKFWSPDNRATVEVTDGQFVVRNVYLDRNFTKNALEVVANNGQQPILQVIWKTPGHMILNGLFNRSDGMLLCMAENVPTVLHPSQASQCQIKPIFKYPSWKFEGVYADN